MQIIGKRDQYKPSAHIQILRLAYDHPTEFWADKKVLIQLSQRLQHYPGPIILNLSPKLVAMNSELKTLLLNPNLIRPFELKPGSSDNADTEKIILGDIKETPLHMGKLGSLVPSPSSYYAPSYKYGTLSYSIEEGAHMVFTYALASMGGSYLLPSVGLQAFRIREACETEIKASSISCKDQNSTTYQFPKTLELYFYPQRFHSISKVNEIREDSNDILIVQIDTSIGKFSDLLGRKIDWAELTATALSNMFQNHYWKRTTASDLWPLLFLICSYILITWALLSKDLRRLMTIATILIPIFVLSDLFLSLEFGLRTLPIITLVILILLLIVSISIRAILDFEQRSILERAFKGYVSEARLKMILAGKENLRLEGRIQNLSVLILDVAGFSKISEEIGPEKSFELIKELYSIIDPIILRHGGVIDKKLGDGLISFFGDNWTGSSNSRSALVEASQQAVDCACEIQEKIRLVEDQFVSNRKLRLRVGINSGETLLGNAGSEIHFDYTVLGPTVNYTQRLEAACEPGDILISETCHEMIQSKYLIVEKQIRAKNDERLHQAFEIKVGKPAIQS